jgi:hypothetical protein
MLGCAAWVLTALRGAEAALRSAKQDLGLYCKQGRIRNASGELLIDGFRHEKPTHVVEGRGEVLVQL